MESPNIAAAVIWIAVYKNAATFVLICGALVAATYLIYRSLFERLEVKTREAEALGRLHLATAEALATAIDAKDQTTHGHVRRVQIYAAGLGKLLRLSAEEIEALKAGAVLHDVGNLAVPPHILNKPGSLSAAEFERMKAHTTVGALLLNRVEFPYPVIPIVRHHHEQWNGHGYPDGLSGEQIPITARIIAVVDCFDAIREDRPFRRGMTRDEAIALLVRGSGSHFDPNIVELFIQHLPEFEAEIAAQGLPQQLSATDVDEPFKLIEVDLAQARERGCHMAYDQIKNAHREVYALYEIARTFGSSLDMDETISILVDKVAHVVPFDTCAVYIYDERQGYATAVHVAGKNATLIKSKSVAPGEGVTGFAMANRSPANQLHPGSEFAQESERAIKYRSMAALPLVKDNSLLGALSVYSMELDQYTDDHVRLLETVTKLASDAIANSIHHAEAKSNALTDLITGLPNARYLAVRFEEEVARARRTGRTFQLIMLDLDDFKIVNDTFGHKIGDKMLREVARIIHGQLREYDFLARYAGDEFVAIVQELVASQVSELRMRIESAVLQYSLHVRGDRRARVGISIGTAAYGLDGETLDQLLIAADQKMYRMKSEHKLSHLSDGPATLPNKRPDPDQPDITSNSVN